MSRQPLLVAVLWLGVGCHGDALPPLSLQTLSVPLSTTVLRIENPAPTPGALFGHAVAGVGDVDGDGVDDLAVGAPGAGRVYLFSGADRSLLRTVEDPDGLPAHYEFGFAVAGLGALDVGGVRHAAMVVGAPNSFFLPVPGDTASNGRATVISASTGETLRVLQPLTQYLRLGFAVEPLGDVNGDGVMDIAVGSPVLEPRWGEVIAFSGLDGAMLWATMEPPFPEGRQEAASFGMFLSGGDRLLVSAPLHDVGDVLSAGTVFVLDAADGTILAERPPPAPARIGYFGATVSWIGDPSGDGVEDYVAGDCELGIELVDGASGAILRTLTIPGEACRRETYGTLGSYAFARTADFSDDGLGDLWVGAPLGGQVFLIDAWGAVLAAVDDPTPPPVPGDPAGFGRSLATGSFGGDTGHDLVVGDPGESVGGVEQAGAVYLVLTSRNRPPVVSVEQPAVTVDEGAVASNHGTVGDPDGDELTLTASVGTVTRAGGVWSWSLATSDGPAESGTVTVTASDGHGGAATVSFALVVTNLAPAVGPLAASPSAPVPALSPVTATAAFSDAGTLDTHVAWFDWGDGSGGPGVVLEAHGAGTAEGTHAYAAPGLYRIQLTVTDDDGDAGSALYQYVVVFDPSGGLVVAAGFFTSPPGACAWDPTLTGRANLALVSRREPHTGAPVGLTRLRLRFADLDFASTQLDWLVITGARSVQRGRGLVDGAGDFGFLVSAVSGGTGGERDPDRVRVKIWDHLTGAVVYDSQPGEPDDASPRTVLEGGAVVIHD